MFAHIFKDSAGATKAWLTRARAVHHVPGPKGKEGKWVATDGKPLTAAERENLAKAKVSPGLKNVHVSSEANADKLAHGQDSKGKVQPTYSDAHWAEADGSKFARVAALTPKIPKLLRDLKGQMNDREYPESFRDHAATVYLMTKTGFRPGGSSEDTYGASDLLKKHITVDEDKINFKFVGKAKQNQDKTIKDKDLALYLTTKMKKMGDDQGVFTTSGAAALRHLRKNVGADYLVKDLRTYNGTALAAHLIGRESVPSNKAELKAQQKRISELVSKHLGNTPKVALDSYIDPSLWKHTGEL